MDNIFMHHYFSRPITYFLTKSGFYLLTMKHLGDTKHKDHTLGLYIGKMHTTNTNAPAQKLTPITSKVTQNRSYAMVE